MKFNWGEGVRQRQRRGNRDTRYVSNEGMHTERWKLMETKDVQSEQEREKDGDGVAYCCWTRHLNWWGHPGDYPKTSVSPGGRHQVIQKSKSIRERWRSVFPSCFLFVLFLFFKASLSLIKKTNIKVERKRISGIRPRCKLNLNLSPDISMSWLMHEQLRRNSSSYAFWSTNITKLPGTSNVLQFT